MSLNWFLECLAKFMVKGEGYPGSEVIGDSAFSVSVGFLVTLDP